VKLIIGFAMLLCLPLASVMSQGIGDIDLPTMTAVMSVDGPNGKKQPPKKQSCSDFTGVEILSLHDYRGDDSADDKLREHVVERWHDKESGVEFICVKDHGCVLTGRKW
jgi:hypothetical protein